MCQECDLLRAHAFLHAFRYSGLWQAFVVQWRTDWRSGKPSRLRWDALFASEEWRDRFLNQNRGAALEALVRDKRGLSAILPTGYGKLLVYQLSFSRCIQCHAWESEFGEFGCFSCFTVRITHTQQFLHSDWLRTCQFIQTERKNVKLSAKWWNWGHICEIKNDLPVDANAILSHCRKRLNEIQTIQQILLKVLQRITM